ncbi:hypothetical protein BGI32_09230 [Snodgrassella alvi]|uniref:Uncharacterized protein n=1 Tax=Snodgrassella alvi TaxID=1196083 RepID=A0A2N9WS67_9NEIS|nr:hypothetical protein BGI32_09230 [Snodgrassella alvi]
MSGVVCIKVVIFSANLCARLGWLRNNDYREENVFLRRTETGLVMGYGCIGMFISTTIKGVYPVYFTNLIYYGVSIGNAGCG